MAVIFGKVRGYLLALQMLQLPLVMLSRTKFLKGKDILGYVIQNAEFTSTLAVPFADSY